MYIYAIWNKINARSWLFNVWHQLSSGKIKITTKDDTIEVMRKEYEFDQDIDNNYDQWYSYLINIDGHEIEMELCSGNQYWGNGFYDFDHLYFEC